MEAIVYIFTIEMGELYSVILLLVLLLFYVCRICICFSATVNDYFLQIFFAKTVVVSYVSYLHKNNNVNVDAAVDVLS